MKLLDKFWHWGRPGVNAVKHRPLHGHDHGFSHGGTRPAGRTQARM